MRTSTVCTISVLLALAGAHPRGAQAQNDPRGSLIVSTAWLADHLKDPDLVLLHVGDPKNYPATHIPGARLVTLRDIAVSDYDREKKTGLTLQLPSADSLRKQLESLGISDRSRIVVYEADEWITPSTRVVFTLDAAGLGARTVWLDGGLAAWTAEQRQVTAEVPSRTAGTLSPLTLRPLVADAAYVHSHLKAPGFHLIDAREPAYYDGIEGERKGHIPGARNIPFTDVTDGHNAFLGSAQLAAVFQKAGVGPRDTVVAYCHIGQYGTAVLFAARLLGHPVKLYDGSFQEWSQHADWPVETAVAEKRP